MPPATPAPFELPNVTSCSGSRTGRLCSITWLMSVKMAVLPPMPRASDSSAIAVNPGLLSSIRTLIRVSCSKPSSVDSQRADHTWCFTALALPISTRAARNASSAFIPARRFSSAEASRNPRSSSSISPSTRFRTINDRKPPAILLMNPIAHSSVDSAELRLNSTQKLFFHSHRSATTGSTREALRAGRNPAIVAIAINRTTAPSRLSGSVGLSP